VCNGIVDLVHSGTAGPGSLGSVGVEQIGSGTVAGPGTVAGSGTVAGPGIVAGSGTLGSGSIGSGTARTVDFVVVAEQAKVGLDTAARTKDFVVEQAPVGE